MSISELSPKPNSTDGDLANERILDAALQQFEEVGVRRTTIEDIARRAGVERVTVYRRIGSKGDVVQAVVGRESARTFETLTLADGAITFEDRIAGAFTAVVRHMWEHPLFGRLIALEPETALPRLTTEGSPVLATAVHATVQMLDHAVRDNLLDAADDFAMRAEIIVRVAHSFIMTPQIGAQLDKDDRLSDFARTYIVPIAAGR